MALGLIGIGASRAPCASDRGRCRSCSAAWDSLDAHRRAGAAADVHLADALDLRKLLRQMMESAASYICAAVAVSEVSARIMIGESAGLTLRYVGLLGRLAGSWPRAALMAACTSRAAASILRFRSNCSVTLVEPSWLRRGHLGDAGDAAELAFERRGHGGGHGLRTRAGQATR